MKKVTLKWGGKAALGSRSIGTWEYDWKSGQSVFKGRMNDGKTSDWMKKRELREWFAKECSE